MVDQQSICHTHHILYHPGSRLVVPYLLEAQPSIFLWPTSDSRLSLRCGSRAHLEWWIPLFRASLWYSSKIERWSGAPCTPKQANWTWTHWIRRLQKENTWYRWATQREESILQEQTHPGPHSYRSSRALDVSGLAISRRFPLEVRQSKVSWPTLYYTSAHRKLKECISFHMF